MSTIAYISLLLIIIPEFSTSISVVQVGTYVLSQKALSDAPERYTSFVLRAIEYANEAVMDDIIENKGCKTAYWVFLSNAKKSFNIERGTLAAVITSGGIQVTAKINAKIQTAVRINSKLGFGFFCFSNTICNSWAVLTGQFSLSIDITAQWSNKISITASPSLIGDNFQISGCHPPWWVNIFANVQQIMHSRVQAQLYDTISKMHQKINIPSSFSPYGGIYFTYQVTSVKFMKYDRILLTANCTVQADKKNSNGSVTRLTFDAPNTDAANMLPPLAWDLELINGSLYQLQGVRLSSTILEAFFWGAQTIGAFNASAKSPFLDTEVTVDSQFTPPVSGVNLLNQLTVSINSGRVYATCKSSLGNSIMIDTSFKSLSGNATIHATANKIGVVIEILQFDVNGHNVEINWPPLPMSPEFVEAMERVAMSNVVPKMNKYFKENPLDLPPDVASLIPNPRLLLFNQNGCCGGTHGYLDFASYCSLLQDESQWKKCQFASENNQLANVPNERQSLLTTFSENEVNLLLAHNQNNSDITGLFMLQYSSSDCSLQCGSETNYAVLSFIAVIRENCTRNISQKHNLLLALKTATGILVGLNCNDSCSIASCLYKIDSVVANTCYSSHSSVFFFNEMIDVVAASNSAVVTSFGTQNTCDIGANGTVTFVSVCPNEECQLAGYFNNQVAMLQRKNENYQLLFNCSSLNCASCSVIVDAVVGQCITVFSNLFEIFTKDSLPKKFKIKYPIGPIASIMLNLILSIILPFLAVSFVIILFVFRKRIWNFDYKTAWISGKGACQKITGYVKNLFIMLIKCSSAVAQCLATIMKRLGCYCKDKYSCFIAYIHNQRKSKLFPLSVDTGCCLFALITSAVVLGLWKVSNPFANYVMPIVQIIGISDGIIFETDKGKHMLHIWEQIVQNGIESVLILNVALVCITTFLNVQTLTVVTLFIEFCAGFVVIFIPPMFINFKDVISFSTSVNNTLPGFIVDFLEPKVKQAFMGISIASLANWNLFWLQGLLGGCVSASVFFWIVCPAIKRTMFSIIGILVPVIIVVPLASLISIIFLYQSFGVDVFWLVVWLLWWTSSIIMLVIIIVSFARQKINKTSINSTQRWLVFVFYIIVHVTVLAYASYRESELTTTSVMFSIGMWLMPMGTILPLLFILLSQKSSGINKEEEEEERQPLLDSENNAKDNVHGDSLDRDVSQQTLVQSIETSINSSENHVCALNLRSTLFVIGGFCMTICLFMSLNDYAHHSVIDYLLNILKEGNTSLQWPKNGTAFDVAFNMYEKSRWDQLISDFVSLAALIIATSLCFVKRKHSLAVSKIFGYLSVIALFSGLIIISSPSYLDSMHIEKYLPNCTAQCNKAFKQSVKTSIGLVCAMIFTGKVSVLAFTFPPALARATGLLFSKWKTVQEREALLFMWLGAPIYSVIITIIPMIFLMQTIGNSIFLFIIACFWLGPLVLSLSTFFIYKKLIMKSHFSTLLPILMWSFLYVSSALTLVFYSVYLYDLWDAFVEMLWGVDFWALIVAELVVSLAVPADFIDSCIEFCSKTVKTCSTEDANDSTEVRPSVI